MDKDVIIEQQNRLIRAEPQQSEYGQTCFSRCISLSISHFAAIGLAFGIFVFFSLIFKFVLLLSTPWSSTAHHRGARE